MENGEDTQKAVRDWKKIVYRKIFIRNALVFGFILVIGWAGLLTVIPTGWGITATNIGFLLISLFVIGIPSLQFLKLYMPTLLAGIVSGLIWVIMVVLIRSIFLELFGVI